MKTKFGLAALDAIQKNYKIILERLIKGYERVTGKQPEGLDLTMIKREAYEKAEDSAKVVDMEGKTLDPSKPIIGGKQQLDEGFSMTVLDEKGNPTKTVKTTPEGIMDTLQRPFGDNIRDAYKGAGRSREEASEMIEALDSPGAKKSYEIMEEALGVRLYGDETFEELMKIKETGVHPRGEPPIKKAEGGIIGEIQNLIGAGLEKGSDLASGAGKFILGAASGIPGLGLVLGGLQNVFNNPNMGQLQSRDATNLFLQESGDTVDSLGRLTSGIMQGYNANFNLAPRAQARLNQIKGLAALQPYDVNRIAQREEKIRALEEFLRQQEAAQIAARANTFAGRDASLNQGEGGTYSGMGDQGATTANFSGDFATDSLSYDLKDGGLATMFVERR